MIKYSKIFWYLSAFSKNLFSKLWSRRNVARRRRRMNLLLRFSRQLMKKEIIVSENCLNSESHFYNHFLWYIYFFFFIRNQKIIVLHFASKFATFWKFFRNVIFDSCFIVFTSIAHLLVNSVYTSYTVLFENSSKFLNLKYSMIFYWIIIINNNHRINSWRKTMNYTRKWSKLLWHDYRALTMHSISW
jgi:hypothetical protein